VSAALVLVGILGALPLLSTAPAGAPLPSATPVPVVTVTPSALPGNATTATTGGDLGRAIAFRTSGASGTVTVHSAVWTDTGDMAAPSGRRYLVVDLTVACDQGSLPVDPLLFLAVAGDAKSLPGFGATLTSPLAGQVVEAGETARGQVGYALTPGAVSLALLDPGLRPVAQINIPAP